MKTNSLIDLLSQSAHESKLPTNKAQHFLLLLSACGVTLAATLILYKINPDLLEAAQTTWFWLRFAFLTSLGVLGFICLSHLGNPGRANSVKLVWLALPSAAMAVIAGALIFNAPADTRLSMILGTTWKVCSISIAFLAIPLFISSVLIVRGFAPTRLKLTGAVLGLFSGALAALIYTLHCPELHPAFLVLWYGLGMLIPAAVGWVLGERLLKW